MYVNVFKEGQKDAESHFHKVLKREILYSSIWFADWDGFQATISNLTLPMQHMVYHDILCHTRFPYNVINLCTTRQHKLCYKR